MLLPRLRRCICAFVVLFSIINAHANDDGPKGAWNWRVMGPFENVNGSAFSLRLDAERPFDTLTYTNARGGILQWRTDMSNSQVPLLLHNYNADPTGAYVINTFVDVGRRQLVTLHAYVVGTIAVYVNDSLAFSSDRDVAFHTMLPIARITLEKGWNRVFVKAGNTDVPFCVVMLNMVDGSGNVLQEFNSTSEPRLYPLKTLAPEPLTVSESQYTVGYAWNSSIVDSVRKRSSAVGMSASNMLDLAVEQKQRGSLPASLEYLRALTTAYPERFDAWFLKGYTHYELGQKDSAIASLELGLQRDPGAAAPKMLLRKLKGQPDFFTYFHHINTDSIIKAGFAAEPRDGGDVDIILNDEKIMVVAGGSTIQQTDQVYRALTPNGARMISKWMVPSEGKVISMQVTDYKHYGDSVVASKTNNSYQLDNVAVGDLVRVRVYTLVRDSTQVPQYYQHRHNLQREFYTHRSLYQTILPLSDKFQWRTFNTLAEPQFVETTVGYHLTWDEKGLKQVPIEQDAPRTEMTGIAEVGTIPNWEYIALRYADALTSKQTPPRQIQELMDRLAPIKDSLKRTDVVQRVREYFMTIPVSSQSCSLGERYRGITEIAENGPKTNVDIVTMFVSMLSTRGITAFPMLIDTTTTPFYRVPLASLPFNHIIAVVQLDSLPLFIDLSRMPYASMASTPTNVRGAFGLVVRKGLREAMFVDHYESMTKYKDEFTSITPLDNGAFRVFESAATTETDSALIRRAITMAQTFRAPDGSNSDSVWCTPVSGTPLLRFCRSTTGSVPFRKSTSDSTILLYDAPWRNAGIYPDSPYDTVMRTLPLLRKWTYDSVTSSVVIHAPLGYTFSKELPKGIFNVEGLRYSLLSIQRGDSLVVTRKVVNTQPYVSPEGYVSFQVAHARMIELDKQPILLVPAPVDTIKRKKKK